MIGNIRLTRSELTRRKIQKARIQALYLTAIVMVAVLICVKPFSQRVSPLVGASVSLESDEAGRTVAFHMDTALADTALIGAALVNAELVDAQADASGIDAEAEYIVAPDAPIPASARIQWQSFYAESNTLVPVFVKASPGSDIAGSLNPGAVVYGYYYNEEWVCIVDASDVAYFVKGEYVSPFSKEASKISLFHSDHEVVSGGFSVSTNINSISGMTLEDIAFLLREYPAFQGLEETILLCEKKYGVNAYFILGVASQESGFGKSALAQRKNNLFGIGAYDESAFESALAFDTKAECIDYFCTMIARYLDNGRTSPSVINEKYASDELWASRVASLMNRYAAEVGQWHGAEG